MAVIEVGKPFPGNLKEGVTTVMEVAPEKDSGVDLMIVANLRNIHPMEIESADRRTNRARHSAV